MDRYLTLFLLGCLLIFSACTKEDPLKKPTEVAMQMYVDTSMNASNTLQFEGGEMILNEIRFEGYRDAGGDVFFTRELDELVVPLNELSGLDELAFDIPQGDYQHIRITLTAMDAAGAEALWVEGSYSEPGEPVVPVNIELVDEWVFTFSADASSQNPLVLVAGEPSILTLTFDPVYWTSTTTDEMWEDADHDGCGTGTGICIHKTENVELYNRLVSRIGGNTNLTLE